MRAMKGRVLVVDDDLALAEMLGIVLRGEGFEPSFVHDGDEAAPEVLQIGDITIDVAGHSVKRAERNIPLTPLEFDLLVALARKPRQVFTREVLLEQVWGYRHAADTRLVNVHVQRLRSKVERDPEHPEVVLTVRGVGYKAGPP